ncbi:protein kinase [Calothrix sp. NIES-2100]|uniref:serine/threonine-protein kinase n=1 Tax=Calothrix sp. NIES-2100 TaxID=1954172 RepID=UPI000B5F4617|nr:protein kinase [Calothrix sp. NIES-2100]
MIGKILRNHYKIIRLLGSGGFGDTYLAEDWDLPSHPKCAVKHLKPKNPLPSVLKVARRLFDSEAQILRRLGNKYDQIPRFLDYFEENHEFYLVQEFVDGFSLADEIPSAPQSLGENAVIKLLQEILEVLVFVHNDDIIHRDIKPQNLIRRKKDSKIILIDFGSIKKISTLVGVNQQGQSIFTVAVGTPGYMPNEQANGDPRLCSDIYAVGIIGIQALTGLLPQQLRKDNTGEIIWRNHAQVSDKLADFLSNMVRCDFNQRYQSASEALVALNALAAPTPTSPPSTEPLPLSRKSLLVLGIGVITTVFLVGFRHYWDDISNPITTLNGDDISNPITTLNGHSGEVNSLAISPIRSIFSKDIKEILASSSDDKTIKIWNLQNRKEIFTFKGHKDKVYTLAISPDAQTLVSGSNDKTIKVWNLNTGQEIYTLKGHKDIVNSVAISADNQTIVSGSYDKTIKVWNLKTGQEIRTLVGHQKAVLSVAISSDNQELISASADRTVKIWNLQTGELLHTLMGHSGDVNAVAINHKEGFFVSVSDDRKVEIWNLSDGWERHPPLMGHSADVNAVAISSDGNEIATGSDDRTIKIWNPNTGQDICTLKGHKKEVWAVAFSPDNKTLFSASADKTIKIWQLPKLCPNY